MTQPGAGAGGARQRDTWWVTGEMIWRAEGVADLEPDACVWLSLLSGSRRPGFIPFFGTNPPIRGTATDVRISPMPAIVVVV